MELQKIDNEFYIKATDLKEMLGIITKFAAWIKYNIKRLDLQVNIDFVLKIEQSTGGRPLTNYLLKRDAALLVTVVSAGQKANKFRKKVIELFNQHETGLAFTSEQITTLIDLSKAMTLVSIQKEVEKKHFDLYNDKYSWYQYRAGLLGYSTKDLISAMLKVNKKHKSIRKSLIRLDANELIRTGVIDFMKALGKTDEYSTNVGNLCKEMAKKMELGGHIWDDTKENPLKINQNIVSERKELFNNHSKGLN